MRSAISRAVAPPLHLLGGQPADELVQTNVQVRLCLCLLSTPAQIHSADAAQILREYAVLKQATCLLPFVLAALNQIVERLAAAAGGENKLVRQLVRRQPSAAVRGSQLRPVVMAKHRFVGVGAATAWAGDGWHVVQGLGIGD